MRYVPIRRRGEYFPMASAFDKFFDNFLQEDKAEENVRNMAIDLVENEKGVSLWTRGKAGDR